MCNKGQLARFQNRLWDGVCRDDSLEEAVQPGMAVVSEINIGRIVVMAVRGMCNLGENRLVVVLSRCESRASQ